ncbi:hypothetical protein CIRG_04879 [Coccidioides immitis RMSCC 2394]|uniref:Uncharacterized protein n=1 Tax=Coccidioides immitis RMSCC 2394 TaxID=404692 RepID=A0A0J6YE25_COCIT|nr:hypothetical protein CIRG_04879 [Coccidioides immitis RMSCC 2394]
MAQRMIQDYKLDKSKYLAIRADEMGVIDIAFQQSHAGPKWILNNLAYPFKAKISVIRSGAEPYFCSKLIPPQDSWVDSGFPVESKLTLSSAPFAYFANATYIPFATLKNINFDVEPSQLGITNIEVNIPNPCNKLYSVCFSNPPHSLRFTLCGRTVVGHTFQYPYIQFEINGCWAPPIPSHCIRLRPSIVVKNVLGIWWSKSFAFIPLQVGVVVLNKANLINTVI